MRGLRQSMENEAVSQIPAIPVRVERYSHGRLKANFIEFIKILSRNQVGELHPTYPDLCAKI